MVRRGIQGVCVKIYSVCISTDFQLEDSTQLLIHYKKVPVNKTEGKALRNIFYYCEHCGKILSPDSLAEHLHNSTLPYPHSPSLAVPKARPDGALSNLNEWVASSPVLGGLE